MPLLEKGIITKQIEEFVDFSTGVENEIAYTDIPLIKFLADLKKTLPHTSSLAERSYLHLVMLFVYP
jgi:hypothetical protein